MTAKVDVVIPVRDGGRLLRRAVDSVLAQEGVDVHVIVVDDGSRDGAPQRLEPDSRLTVVANRGRGIADGLETGFATGTAPYVARQDADDVSLPGRLRRQVAHLEENPGIGLVSTGFEVLVGRRTVAVMNPGPAGMLARNPLCAGSTMVRREVHEQAGGYRREFALSSDYDMWLRYAEVSGVTVLPEPGYRYRLTSSMVTIRGASRQAAYAQLARASAEARRIGAPDPVVDAQSFVDRLLVNAAPEPDPELDAWWAQEFAALGDRREALRCIRRASARLPRRRTLRLLLTAAGRPRPQTAWT